MTKVIFIEPDGKQTEIDAKDGASIMQTAVENNVGSVIGECGGSMACATCHCYVDEAWASKTGEQSPGEGDMLDCAASEVRPTSRLSCQITVSPALDGVVIHLPPDQI